MFDYRTKMAVEALFESSKYPLYYVRFPMSEHLDVDQYRCNNTKLLVNVMLRINVVVTASVMVEKLVIVLVVVNVLYLVFIRIIVLKDVMATL